MSLLRLDKYLADAGVGTRSEVKKYIKNKWIRVGEQIATKPEMKVNPETDVVYFRDKAVNYEEYVYYMFHKPSGCVTARSDSFNKTVMDYFPETMGKGLSPVGRLDKDTEGLLLVTNDGELNHYLMSPGHHVEKTYYAILDHQVPEESVNLFREGVDIGDDKLTLPAKLCILPEDTPFDAAYEGEDGVSHATLTISEGRYHQVKRMFAKVGCEVVYLKRLSLGKLELGNLKRGEIRKIAKDDVN